MKKNILIILSACLAGFLFPLAAQDAAQHEDIARTFDAGDNDTYQATDSITATSIVQSGATITFKAADKIQFNPGFHAQAGSVFIATAEALAQTNGGNPAVNEKSSNKTPVIEYTIPDQATNAHIRIYDLSGLLLKTIHIDQADINEIHFDTTSLSQGIYIYSLEADGKQISSQKILVTK